MITIANLFELVCFYDRRRRVLVQYIQLKVPILYTVVTVLLIDFRVRIGILLLHNFMHMCRLLKLITIHRYAIKFCIKIWRDSY